MAAGSARRLGAIGPRRAGQPDLSAAMVSTGMTSVFTLYGSDYIGRELTAGLAYRGMTA